MYYNSTGPVRGGKIRMAPHGVRAGPVSGRTIFVQNSPGTARTGPGSVMWLRHQSHPTTGPVRFIAPVFARKRPSEAPVTILRRCCYRGHIRLRAPYGCTRLYTYLWCDRIILMTPHGPRIQPTRASFGTRTGISNVFHIHTGPYGHRKWTYNFLFKTAREQPVRGPGVWCGRGIMNLSAKATSTGYLSPGQQDRLSFRRCGY